MRRLTAETHSPIDDVLELQAECERIAFMGSTAEISAPLPVDCTRTTPKLKRLLKFHRVVCELRLTSHRCA
jgi:hypothetical protein